MTSPALLMIVASIVSVQEPMAQIDLGFSDGLIEGVEGQAYYELTVAGQPRRIDVGRATITAVEASTATIRLAATRPLYPGQQVEFEIAQPKPPLIDPSSTDRASMDQSTAPVVLVESSSVADVVDYETRMEPEAEPIIKDTIAMTTIDGGAQWVGLDPGQAEFFNQTPRFATEIDAYRIDLEPASDGTVSDGPVVRSADLG